MAGSLSMRAKGRRATRAEPTLPLINVVFLMLVFFLVAAQVARPLDGALDLVKTDDPQMVPPADALVLHADGRQTWRGAQSSMSAMLEGLAAEGYDGPARILPDRNASATQVLDLARTAHGIDAERRIVIVTQRALP